MTAANQHIEVDGDILRKQMSLIQETSAQFSSAAREVSGALPGDAFGVLNQGLVVPLANAVGGRSRELLASAQELADRISTGIEAALATFTTVEEDAAATFSNGDR